MQLCQSIEGRDLLEGRWFIYLICHCVPWRRHFIMYTGKVSVLTAPCHSGRRGTLPRVAVADPALVP